MIDSMKKNLDRDINNDRQCFIEAVKSTPIRELTIDVDESASNNLNDNLKKSKIFILGETHGVKENADVIYTLFKKLGFRQLALEWEPNLKDMVIKFLKTGEVDFEAIQNSPDGRISAGHFALIKKLQSEELLEQLICFDGSSERDWNARDDNMAKEILGNLSESATLVVAGNLHAQTKPVTFTNESDEHHPMGEKIRARIPDAPAGIIDYQSGQYHNFGINNFAESVKTERVFSRFYQKADGSYVFTLPKASVAIVPNPSERLSLN